MLLKSPTIRYKDSTLLKMLIKSALTNYGKKKQGYRYEDPLKLFFTYIFILGGRILYDSLAENLPIPGSSSILRYISSNATPMIEGTLRIIELEHFLKIRNLPSIVWLSEDATRIVGRVQYDPQTNQLVGFVLPFGANGMPISCTYLATSAREIENHFAKNTIATSLYTIMVQPLQDGAPCFCLCVFGTDNKFDAKHVVDRWEYIVERLEHRGITVAGFSSDGDSRLMKSMRIKTNLGVNESDFTVLGEKIDIPEFHAHVMPRYICIQDTVHMGAKFLSRLLKPSIVMPLGNFVVSAGHLQILIDNVSKDKHQLTPSNLNSKDKMNFESVEKISHPRIWLLLEKHVPGSEGTRAYLTLVYYIINSFLCTEINIESRIFCIWFSAFFLRLWRAWLNGKSEYSLTNNGITANAYICVELNAHGLLNAIFNLQKQGSIKNFIPWQYSSQQCESFFRNLRSTSTTFSTVVNCTLLEAIHRHLKLQLQADISVFDFKGEDENLNFPRTRHLNASYETQNKNPSIPLIPSDNSSNFPSITTIKNIIKKAKADAFKVISELGMEVDPREADKIQISEIKNDLHADNLENDNNLDQDETEDAIQSDCDSEELLQDLTVLSGITGELELPNHSGKQVKLSVDSPFTVVTDTKGKEYIIRKSSICWFLSTKNSKLSADRLQRVQGSELEKKKKRLLKEKNDSVVKLNEIGIGDWCLFKEIDSKKCLIGLVLSFAYPEGKTWRSVEYSSSFANVTGNTRSIGVLCQWYKVDSDGHLILLELASQGLSHGYVDIEQYRLTIPAPTCTETGCALNPSVFNSIKHKVL